MGRRLWVGSLLYMVRGPLGGDRASGLRRLKRVEQIREMSDGRVEGIESENEAWITYKASVEKLQLPFSPDISPGQVAQPMIEEEIAGC